MPFSGGSGSSKEGSVVKGGVGTQSKNCIHECAFPPSFSEADVEAAVAKLRCSAHWLCLCVHAVARLERDGFTASIIFEFLLQLLAVYIRQENSLPSPMAKEFTYTLDPFQRQSVCCIERLESVLVAAHTSAGDGEVLVPEAHIQSA